MLYCLATEEQNAPTPDNWQGRGDGERRSSISSEISEESVKPPVNQSRIVVSAPQFHIATTLANLPRTVFSEVYLVQILSLCDRSWELFLSVCLSVCDVRVQIQVPNGRFLGDLGDARNLGSFVKKSL